MAYASVNKIFCRKSFPQELPEKQVEFGWEVHLPNMLPKSLQIACGGWAWSCLSGLVTILQNLM
uniref:Uncharacterized protein n=1 Tax=Manihot esculenta TaxID=3983 RepID=A0A2C9VIV5_MANES